MSREATVMARPGAAPWMLFLVFLTMQTAGVGRGAFTPMIVVILAVVAWWLASRALAPQAPIALGGLPSITLVFFAATLASALGRHPLEVFPGIVSTAPKLLLAVVLVDAIAGARRVTTAVVTLLWTSSLFALAGVIQVALYFFWHIELSIADPNFRYMSDFAIPWLRATGLSGTAGQFAAPLCAALVIAVYLLLSPWGRGRRAALAAAAVVLTAGVILSFVRGSWVAAAAGIAAIPFIARPRWSIHWATLGVLAALTVLATGAAGQLVTKLNDLSGSGLDDRRALVAGAFDAIATHPLNGVGINNFDATSPTFERYPVHNAFLQAGSELGVPGLLGLVAVTLWVGVRLARAVGTATDTGARALAGAMLAGLVTVVAVMQGEPMAYSQFVWIYFALGEAVARHVLSTTSHGASNA